MRKHSVTYYLALIAVSFVAMYLGALIFFPMAATERGYSGAFGGEVYLIAAIGVITFRALNKLCEGVR